jgi:hypothetical protein
MPPRLLCSYSGFTDPASTAGWCVGCGVWGGGGGVLRAPPTSRVVRLRRRSIIDFDWWVGQPAAGGRRAAV